MLTQRAKDTSNTRFVPCISANLHSDLVRERLGCIPSVRNLRPRDSRQLFFMGEKPTEEFQFASILVPCLDDLFKLRSPMLSSPACVKPRVFDVIPLLTLLVQRLMRNLWVFLEAP